MTDEEMGRLEELAAKWDGVAAKTRQAGLNPVFHVNDEYSKGLATAMETAAQDLRRLLEAKATA
jgi:hypothetical protein